MSKKKEYILSDSNENAFKKFLFSYTKKQFPFITKIEFEELPYLDLEVSRYYVEFLITVYIDYKYIINDNRAMRHVDKDTVDKMVKETTPISDWHMRLWLKFSEWDFKKKILELLSYITAENYPNHFPAGNVTFLIDPSTYVS